MDECSYKPPKELTSEDKQALEMLAGSGIPLGNQSVLLKGVNDDISTMKSLVINYFNAE